jgi:methylmalonyl-CoA mutase
MSDDTATADDPTFTEFPPATREQWLKLLSGALKGSSFEKRLVSRTYDGIAIEPLYDRAAKAQPVFGRTAGAPWQVLQRIEHPDPAAANAQALHDLNNGATGLSLVCAGAVGEYGFGLACDEASVARALDGVMFDAGIALDLQVAAADWNGVVHALTDAVRARGTAPETIDIRFGLDWIGEMAKRGQFAPHSDFAAAFAATIRNLSDQGYRGPFAVADARVIHDAGGSEAQELAYGLAVALSYLRALEASGVALDQARRMIYFRLAADADQFLTTAKFRALRKLWARVEEACALPGPPVFIAADTAWRMMTRRDPFVNMLRTTMAVVAAGLGGADSITVLPHTAAIGLPDEFARRIARNAQLILLEESSLAKVADPAAGSGGIESLTHELSLTAWTLFQEIEMAGGVVAALEQGLLQAKIAAVRGEREKAIARRKDALTGTSEFPNLAEAPATVLELAPLSRPASAAALPCFRLAGPFEALRDASDITLAKTGVRPKVFLANLGRLTDFTPRASYAKNFFEAGGVEAITNDGFASRDDMLAAFKVSGAGLACLCSSDEVYGSEAVDVARALSAAGSRHVYLAGRPGELETALNSAGVGTFIYVGCDVVATLDAAQEIAGPA